MGGQDYKTTPCNQCVFVWVCLPLISDHGTAGSPASQPHDALAVSEPGPPKQETLRGFFKEATMTSATAPESLRELMKTELSAYLQSLSADSESDPLQWWEDQEGIGHRDGPSAQARMWSCHGASLVPEPVDRLVFLALIL